MQRTLVGLAEYHPQQQQRLYTGYEKGKLRALVEEGIAEEEGRKEHEGEIERDVKLIAEGQSLKRATFIICDQGYSPLVEEEQTGCDHKEEEQSIDEEREGAVRVQSAGAGDEEESWQNCDSAGEENVLV